MIRRAMAAALLVAMILPAAVAAHDTRWYRDGKWVHPHASTIRLYNDVEPYDGELHRAVFDSAVRWSESTEVFIEFVYSGTDADIVVRDYYADDGWDGYAETCYYHCPKGKAWINRRNMDGELDKLQTSCHEIGHTLGLHHDTTGEGEDDCMGGLSSNFTPGPHSIYWVNKLVPLSGHISSCAPACS